MLGDQRPFKLSLEGWRMSQSEEEGKDTRYGRGAACANVLRQERGLHVQRPESPAREREADGMGCVSHTLWSRVPRQGALIGVRDKKREVRGPALDI